MTPDRVRLSVRARFDADRIFTYLAERSRTGAEAWSKAFLNALESLTEDPSRFPRASESDDLEVDLHEVFFRTSSGNPYRILFIVRKDIAFVTWIRGTGQNSVTLSDLDFTDGN